MPGPNDVGLTREGLIWEAAKLIASAEKKPFHMPGSLPNISRDYVLNLIRVVSQAVDGKGAGPAEEMSDQELQSIINKEGGPE